MAKVISASLTGTLEPKSLALSALSTPGGKKIVKRLNFRTVLRVLTRKINAVSTYILAVNFKQRFAYQKKIVKSSEDKKILISKNEN